MLTLAAQSPLRLLFPPTWRQARMQIGLRKPLCNGVVCIQLEQVPKVPVEVFEDGHQPIIGLFGFSDKLNPFGEHAVVISPEIIRVKE